MNSRNSVNETNLVDFSEDLSTLNQLDTKDGLLTFPFDHIYACHSTNAERTATLDLDKEVEISTHCVLNEDKDLAISSTSDITRLSEKLEASEHQNKKLKDLIVYHLDLIQQQNELITKKDKLYQTLKQENEALKTKLNRRLPANQRHTVTNPTLIVQPPVTTSTVVKTEPPSQIMLNSFTELLLPDTGTNSFLYESDINKNKAFGQDPFNIKSPETDISYLPAVTSILDSNLNTDPFKMIENKRTIVKKEVKTEPRPEPLYTVTTNSGMPVIQGIQRNRRRTTGVGSMSRLNRQSATKTETADKPFEDDKNFDQTFGLNKKNKMINTYGKSKTAPKKLNQYSTTLADRLQLIDKTPTGQDPYQLGEADMREQSPIPKLMLAKSNRVRTNRLISESNTSRLVYDPPATEASTKGSNAIKLDEFDFTTAFTMDTNKETDTVMIEEPDLDLVKTEPEINWSLYTNKPGNETSLCDFSYGETPNNLASNILPTIDFQELFGPPDGPLSLDLTPTIKPDFPATTKATATKSKRRGARTTSLVAPNDPTSSKAVAATKKGGRQRAFSTGLAKGIKRENIQKPAAPKQKAAKGKAKGKKSPVPGLMSKTPYQTLVGDPDLSWYLGLDPDIKLEDVDPTPEAAISTVEVPRWREKPYSPIYSAEGTENLDDKIFEKRHQKLEAEERRQLRWHMRRIREQRHVERLRQRQRDPWWSGNGSSAHQPPSVFTIWPQPQRDVRFIEITDTLPVMAFGEILPGLPPSDFTLPWVKTPKAQKRSKRSKTLH